MLAWPGNSAAFAQKSLADGRLRLRAEVRQGVGGHDGLVADTLIGWSDQRRDYRLLWTVELNAADSSLVSTRGRRDQFSGGLGYGYRFNW